MPCKSDVFEKGRYGLSLGIGCVLRELVFLPPAPLYFPWCRGGGNKSLMHLNSWEYIFFTVLVLLHTARASLYWFTHIFEARPYVWRRSPSLLSGENDIFSAVSYSCGTLALHNSLLDTKTPIKYDLLRGTVWWTVKDWKVSGREVVLQPPHGAPACETHSGHTTLY